MIKPIKDFSEKDQLTMALQGTSFVMQEANRAKNIYEKYKTGGKKELSEETSKDMIILEILQKLGFPLDELGTYLYKDMIREIYDRLDNIKTLKEVYQYKTLLNELGNPFSSFYLHVARELNDIGIKSFHLYIQKAILKIEEEHINMELLQSIYDNKFDKQNYGIDAYKIAAYTLKQNKFFSEKTNEHKKKLIRKIEKNMPKRIDRIIIEGASLKNEF